MCLLSIFKDHMFLDDTLFSFFVGSYSFIRYRAISITNMCMIYTSGGQKFMLLGADINLSGTVWSAADRIRKLVLRGQCGTVRFHAVLN